MQHKWTALRIGATRVKPLAYALILLSCCHIGLAVGQAPGVHGYVISSATGEALIGTHVYEIR